MVLLVASLGDLAARVWRAGQTGEIWRLGWATESWESWASRDRSREGSAAGRDVAIAGQEDFGIWGAAGETCGSCSRVLSSRSLTREDRRPRALHHDRHTKAYLHCTYVTNQTVLSADCGRTDDPLTQRKRSKTVRFQSRDWAASIDRSRPGSRRRRSRAVSGLTCCCVFFSGCLPV